MYATFSLYSFTVRREARLRGCHSERSEGSPYLKSPSGWETAGMLCCAQHDSMRAHRRADEVPVIGQKDPCRKKESLGLSALAHDLGENRKFGRA